MSLRTSPCRGCHRPVLWAFTEAGRRMPLDPEPIERPEHGTQIVWRGDDGALHCRAALPLIHAGPYFVPHWATCPRADQFKQPKGGNR